MPSIDGLVVRSLDGERLDLVMEKSELFDIR